MLMKFGNTWLERDTTHKRQGARVQLILFHLYMVKFVNQL